MRSRADPTGRKTRRDLVLLFAASISGAGALATGITVTGGAPVGLGSQQIVVVALVVLFAIAAGILVWRAVSAARAAARAAKSDADQLRKSLDLANTLQSSEPQVVLLWEHGGKLRMLTHRLDSVPGLPFNEEELLRFQQWLDARSAGALKSALDALFLEGRPFGIILRTLEGSHIEAEGRATGTSAVLRLKDVAGYKRDLGQIIDQQHALARDIRACRALLDALPMPVWLKDQQGHLSWVNSAYAAAVEATDGNEVIDRQIELIETRQRKAISRTVARGKTFRERLHLVARGERKAHDVVVIPLDDAIAGAAIDVAAIESAQGEFDRQVAAYDRTLDRVATAVVIFSKDQRLTFFNEAYQRLWQLDAGWLETGPTEGALLDRLRALGRLPEVVKYPEWKSKALARYETGTPLDEWWHLPDGRMLHVISEQRPDGGLTYLYVDETERIALETSYNALISVQRETLDSLKEAVAVFATDGRLQLHNTAFERIWKLSRRTLDERPHIDEIIHLARVLHDNPADWSGIHRAVAAFTDEREPVEGQMIRPDQSVIDYASTPLPDGATLITFADVTDARHYQRALEERNEALIAADRLKNQFIGHVSYELRTPLNSIIGFTELLESPLFGTLNPKQREYLGDISSSSKTLLAIIDDILDLATIDAGALELKHDTVVIRDVIDSAVRAVSERAARNGLTLDIAVADDARELVADQARVRQVLYNLLSNAVGFSNHGGVVRLSAWRDDGHIIFMVEDEGVGIPLDQQAHVFDRFESRSHGSNHRGAGLGLSMVKSIVELHGGEVALVSEPGQGTRIAVRLPENGARPATRSSDAQTGASHPRPEAA